ncbi:hypothetical protein O9H85_27615 [Paenibacillus filicis]|uniref:Uncharacterized protein n=1 Tax=Paenibacillus gyeongsangnamensis TaxID=3388067 RepID=A0ABT4QH32_9BACL|nr:hypothetical protein [Paenibacillus filicis]MCZ8516103.1 hypothetical protein [Paenibacillus filicis]
MKIIALLIITALLIVIAWGERFTSPHHPEKTASQASKTTEAISSRPAPQYITPKIALNQNVIDLYSPLSVDLDFKADQDTTLDETSLAFYQLGKQVPALSIPLYEWSHVSLKREDEKKKNITLIPSEKGLVSGYYQVQLEFRIGGTRIAAPSDLLIQYGPGTLMVGKAEINQSVTHDGFTLLP